MASGGAEGDSGGIPLDIDNVHMLLQVEHEQTQRRTFTNWINAQLSKRSPPSRVSDLFLDLRDGSKLLDLLEVMSGQSLPRQRGRGVFQQRTNVETALNFLKKKSIKLVNINISDIIDGRPSIILGLIWTVILHCHIDELASALSFSSRHSSLDSLASLDSWSGSPILGSPVTAGRTSPLHRCFRISAKKALLMWVRDQCQKVQCSISVKDFKASWRSGEAFLAILCSLRPQLLDLSLVKTRSNQENLEEAFHLAEMEMHIPRLLEPQDVDVKDPDEKSIMTYVAQFLQYSSDMPGPDDHLQLFPQLPSSSSAESSPAQITPAVAVPSLRQVPLNQRVQEVICWLQQAAQELSESWTSAVGSSYAEKYQVFQRFANSAEQRRTVLSLLAATKRNAELRQEQLALKTAWDHLEEELGKYKADLDQNLPHPLDLVVVWLQRGEAELQKDGAASTNHAEAAMEARVRQDKLKTLIEEMSHYNNILESFKNTDTLGNVVVPPEKLEELKNRLTGIRVTAKYDGIKLEFLESMHTVLDLLTHIRTKVQAWKGPYGSEESVHVLLMDWHETVERQGLHLILMDALQTLKEKAKAFSGKPSLGEELQRVSCQVKESEREGELVSQAVTTVKGTMERVANAWKTYNKHLTFLQTRSPVEEVEGVNEWTSRHAQLNEAGNFLIEVSETTTSFALTEQLSKVNKSWAERIKKTVFEVPSGTCLTSLPVVSSVIQEASLLVRKPVEVASVPLKANIQKLQSLKKNISAIKDGSSFMDSQDFEARDAEKLQQTLQMLAEAERTCAEMQRVASRLEAGLAKLDHWSSGALDCYTQLKEKRNRGAHGPEETAKAMVSRGWQLAQEVETERQCLQEHVEGLRKHSMLHFSISFLHSRVSASEFHYQEILRMFENLGFQHDFGKHQETVQPETGSYVVAKTRQVEKVMLQTLNQTSLPRTAYLHGFECNLAEDGNLLPRIHMGLVQEILSARTNTTAGCPEKSSPEETPTETQKIEVQPRTGMLAKAPQNPLVSQPPVMICSEVQLKAKSMAKSRLQRAGLHLHGRIQQALLMFANREVSDVPLKKTQRALESLQPLVLEEFLGAVEGFGAFCSGAEAQDLLGLSKSVRKQWETVTGKDAPEQKRVEALKEIFENLAPWKPSIPVSDQLTDQTNGAVIRGDGRRYLEANTPLCLTDFKTDSQPGRNLRLDQQEDRSPLFDATFVQHHVAEGEEPLMQSKHQKPSLCAKEQWLKVRLLDSGESSVERHTQIQAVVRSNTVDSKQEAEWTMIPEVERSSEQKALKGWPSAEENADQMESLKALTTEKIEQIIKNPVDVSSLKLLKPTVISDLKEMHGKLQAEIRCLGQNSEEPLHQELHCCAHNLDQLRRQVEEVQTVFHTLDHFLTLLKDIKGEMPTSQDPARPEDEALWQQERFQPAIELADFLDRSLKTAGITLTMAGAAVTTQDVVRSVCEDLEVMKKMATRRKHTEEQMREHKELDLLEILNTDSSRQSEQQESFTPRSIDEELSLEAKRSRHDEENNAKSGAWTVEVDPLKTKEQKTKRRSFQIEKDGTQKLGFVQRRSELLAKLKDTKVMAEKLELQEPSLPALQQRSRILIELQSLLAGLLSEVQHICGTSPPSENLHEDQSREVEELWEEAKKAVAERLEQCSALTELMRKFQTIRAVMSGTMQRAEGAISQQTFYVGKENLLRLHAKLKETRSELNDLGENIEDLRRVSRQLHALLRQVPGCTAASFEGEAEAFMDRWLDLSERTESSLDNLHLCLTLWDGVLSLEAEVISWTDHKLAAFAQSPSFENESEIETLKNEIMTQEDSVENFHRRAMEIQALLHSVDFPLELQVLQTQMRKKLDELKDLVSEAEEVYKQTVATKGQITGRMMDCMRALQKIQDSLLTLGGPDVTTVLAKLKELCWQLHSQEEEAASAVEDVRLLGSIRNPGDLQGLLKMESELQEKVRKTHQIFAEVEEQTERGVQDLNRSISLTHEAADYATQQVIPLQNHKRATEIHPRAPLEGNRTLAEADDSRSVDTLAQQRNVTQDSARLLGEEEGELPTDVSRMVAFQKKLDENTAKTFGDFSSRLEATSFQVGEGNGAEEGGSAAFLSVSSSEDQSRVTEKLPQASDYQLPQRGEMDADPERKSGLCAAAADLGVWSSTGQKESEAQGSNRCEDIKRSRKVLTIVLDLQMCNIQQTANIHDSSSEDVTQNAELCGAKLPEAANSGFCQMKPTFSTLSLGSEPNQAAPKRSSLNPPAGVKLSDPEKLESNESTCTGEDFTEGTEDEAASNDVSLQNEGSKPTPGGTPKQIQDSMDPDRSTLDLPACLAAGEAAGGSAEPSSTMESLFSEIQSAVASSDIIKGTRETDLKWCLEPSHRQTDALLVRTVQQVLTCRYQPAQLSLTAMTKQLEEAQEYRCQVQEYMAEMINSASFVPDSSMMGKTEDLWNTALVDASATVEVKAAQLDQVRQFHRDMKVTRVFLQVLAAEKDAMSLDALESSAVQVDRLGALLQTMERKKPTMALLLQQGSQLSVHLSDDSSGTLIAQIGDIQEEWRLLEGNIKRNLRQATNSTAQSFLILREAEELQAKLESLSNCEANKPLEFLCLTADLKLYNQLCFKLQSRSDALVSFPLGKKEKTEIEQSLKRLGSLLEVTKMKFASLSKCNRSLIEVNQQFRDLILWAKQAENRLSAGQNLALFPEETRIQIGEMSKLHMDILRKHSKVQEELQPLKSEAIYSEEVKTVEELYEAIGRGMDRALDNMKKHLTDREKLLSQFASLDSWLAETQAQGQSFTQVESVSERDMGKLENELQSHRLAIVEIKNQLTFMEALSENCAKISDSLGPGESRFLVNRLSGLWMELEGLLAHEEAITWELEELIQEWTSSNVELDAIQLSLEHISAELDQQRFPPTDGVLSLIAHVNHELIEHQWQVQELPHCQETQRNTILHLIGELQEKCKALTISTFEQGKYLHLRRQMEESRDLAKELIQHTTDEASSVAKRFKECQTLLVKLPLMKTLSQEAADQLEAVSQELHLSQLSAEREMIRLTLDTLLSWEESVTKDIKHLESKLLESLELNSELPFLIKLFEGTKKGLEGIQPVPPEEKTIDAELQQFWMIWRNMESGIRMLEGLFQKEKVNVENHKELFSFQDAAMKECHSWMVSLSQARESLKDYQWATQEAMTFLHYAEATFLSASGGFLDCTEEHQQTQQALQELEDGFQAHICQLMERLPQQPCLLWQKLEQLHVGIVSQLLVGRVILEAQAQLRLESLHRFELQRQSYKTFHKDMSQSLSRAEARLLECSAEGMSYEKCVAQQEKVKFLTEDLCNLAGKIEELSAGCPILGCKFGKDGKLRVLWRRWLSLRRNVGLLAARIEQRREEWMDINTNMNHCCSFLACLQAGVQDPSISFDHEEPQEVLAQAEIHQAGLEQEQQVISSLEHQLEHAFSLSASQKAIGPGPVSKTLFKIRENTQSLQERNLLVVAAAQAEETERQHLQKELREVEKHLLTILPTLEVCSDPNNRQELKEDLCSLKTKVTCIADGVQSRYADVPDQIKKQMQIVQQYLQTAEETLLEQANRAEKLGRRIKGLDSELEKVKMLLEQKNATLGEAQNALKLVWDELEVWHSSLMILESEVQDLAEEHPHEAQLLMDLLTEPLQLYQSAAWMAEQQTAFLSRVPTHLQEFEDILSRASCWLDEAQTWLSLPCSFTNLKSLQNHAKSLQFLLDDSERIRHSLQRFRSMVEDVASVCEVSCLEKRLEESDQNVCEMQHGIKEPLQRLLQAVAVVEVIEVDLKAMEKNVARIQTILSSVDMSSISLIEHLNNCQVILANLQSMDCSLEEIESCKGSLHIAEEAEEKLLIFSRAKLLQQQLQELHQVTQDQVWELQNRMKEEEATTNVGASTTSGSPSEIQYQTRSKDLLLIQEAFGEADSEEDEEESHHSSSSDTLTSSFAEDLEEMVNQIEDLKENTEHTDSHLKSADISLLSVKSGFDGSSGLKNTETGSKYLDFKDGTPEGFSPTTADPPQTATVSVTEAPFDNAAPDTHAPPATAELLSICPHMDAPAGDTRLIPCRPKTPIMANRSSGESREDDSQQVLSLLDDLEQSEIFRALMVLKDAPSLEFSNAGCLRRCAGRGTEIQQAARALLQGAARLLDLVEGCFIENQVTNHSKLKAVCSRHKKLLQVFSCQLSFAQHLFQREPKTLQGQEDERVQLEQRYKALLQPALEQEASSQMLLQECWEECCARLGEALDEAGGGSGGGELEGDGEEKEVQRRLDACEQSLQRLQDSRAVLGLLLDLETLLQADTTPGSSIRPVGGILELRWRSACRKAEQDVQRCRKIRDIRVRFQTGLDSLSDRLQEARERLKALAALAGPSHQDPDVTQSSLLKLLDFSMEMETVSTLRASVSQYAGHLRDADALRLHLNELEVGWSQMTSDLSRMQEQLLQLAVWPPLKLMSGMEDRRKSLEVQLHQEKERLRKTQNAAEVAEVLQKYQGLKAAAARVLLLLDFLSQPESGITGTDLQALCLERMAFAEEFGTIRFRWLLFQTEMGTQICEAEQLLRTCAERERHLQALYSWIQLQEEQLDQVKRSGSQSLTQKALLEWEEKKKEVSAALQEMKVRKESDDLEEKHLSDVIFSDQVERVTHAFEELCSQVEALRRVPQEFAEYWALFQKQLEDVTLLSCRLHLSLQLERAPVFSLKQAEEDSHLLQDLQVRATEWGGLWAAVDKSYQRLAASRPPAATQVLSRSLEAERKRWKDVVQEIQDEFLKTRRMISLWHEYSRVSDSCSSHLQLLWQDWDSAATSCNQQDPKASVCLLEDAANELQSTVGDVLMASKPLLDWLDPRAANVIHSETRLLSRDVLLLKQVVLERKRSLEIHLQQQNLFQAQLEALEKQMQELVHKVQTPVNDTDSAKELLQELSALLPSLVEIKETSPDVVLNNQERLQKLCRRWRDSMTQASHLYRRLHEELQRSRSFEENLNSLTTIQEELERESLCMKISTYLVLQEMLVAQQKLQAEISVGHQLLQDLLCHDVQSAEKSEEDRSELVTSVKKSWLTSMLVNEQNWTSIKERLHQWRVYRCGTERLQRLSEILESFLPLTGQPLYTLLQLQSCRDLLQKCVAESVGQHSAVFTQTVAAADHLLEVIPECEGRTRLKAELQETKEIWQKNTFLLRRNQNLVDTTIQMWKQSQDGITEVTSELDNVKQLLAKKLEESKEVEIIQEIELCLQRSSTGLRESASIRTRLSQHVAASDAAVLEQQLEQLHAQWEELCVKVSLRKQEIADRLNAWTIFNDKNKEFSDWLTQMEKKICHTGDLSIEEMVEKLKKDCMEEMNLFSENKSHLKQLGEQLLLASDEAKQTHVRGSLQEVNQRWNNLFHHIGARVKKLKETLVNVEQLDKNMSNLRSWLSRVEAELARPITYSVCHQREIQRRLAEQQALQEDVEQHAEAVASVLSLCGVLLRDEDAAAGTQAETDSLQETSHSLDQRWRTICTLALDRRLRIEETWTLWCKFLNDYSCFEDWLKIAERTAANPNSADVPFTLAKEELVKFEGFQRQVNERLTQLEILNNQYRRLARENRTDRAGHLQTMVREGNRRWALLHRRVNAILRRLRHFTGQREEFEGTRKSLLVWLTELDLQLTNVEHFSESDVHHKIQQLNSFQKEITLNTERIDGLIVSGEGLIKKSSPQDAELIEDELEELHSYCQEVFSRLVRFHQRLSQHVKTREEPEPTGATFSLESSLELIGRPWLGRSQGSLPATPTHLLTSPLEPSGRETPVSVDSLPLEWDHTGDVGSSSHEDDEEDEEEEAAYFSSLSGGSVQVPESQGWQTSVEQELDAEDHGVTTPSLSSTPLKQAYLRLTSQCSGSIQNLKRVSLILDDEEQPEEFGLTGLAASDQQSGVIERWELLRAQSRQQAGPQEPQQLASDLDDITSWLEAVIPELELLQQSDPAASITDMEARAKEIKEIQRMFSHYKSTMLSINLQAEEAPDRLMAVNREWSRASTALQQWDSRLRKTLMRCQEFHESLHSLLLWLPHAESRRYTVDVNHPGSTVGALRRHYSTLTELQEELRVRRTRQAALQALWSQLRPEDGLDGSEDTQEKLFVTGSRLQLLQTQVEADLCALQQHLDTAVAVRSGGGVEASPDDRRSEKQLSSQRETRTSSPPRSFFLRVLRAAFPLQLLLLLLLLLPCLIPLSEGEPGCTLTNNFARSFYPMLHYTNGPPPT